MSKYHLGAFQKITTGRGDECIQHITQITRLTGRCMVCGSPNVTVRLEGTRTYPKKSRIMSGGVILDYCAEHDPVNFKEVEKDWIDYCTTPL